MCDQILEMAAHLEKSILLFISGNYILPSFQKDFVIWHYTKFRKDCPIELFTQNTNHQTLLMIYLIQTHSSCRKKSCAAFTALASQ